MKTAALISLLPFLGLAKIIIEITVPQKNTPLKIEAIGTNEDLISEKERNTFQLTDNNLKSAVNAHFGAKPTHVYLKSPTPWGDLFITNDWKQVSRILKPVETKVLSVEFQQHLVYSEVFNNTHYLPTIIEAQIRKDVQNTVSSMWNRSGIIFPTEDIEYNFVIKGMAVSEKTFLSYNSSWGENVIKSKNLTVGTVSGLEIFLRPTQSVKTELYAKKAMIKFQVDYQASLSGTVAVNYEELFKDHHFWSIDINKVLVAGGLKKTVVSSEVIDIDFYVGSNVDIFDLETDETLTSVPLSVF